MNISNLREKFNIHLREKQPKFSPIPKQDEPVTVVPEVKKEDKISPFYCETQIARFKPQNQSSSIILQFGFCCDKPKSKVLVTNHVAQLIDCRKDRCEGHIIKVPLEMN